MPDIISELYSKEVETNEIFLKYSKRHFHQEYQLLISTYNSTISLKIQNSEISYYINGKIAVGLAELSEYQIKQLVVFHLAFTSGVQNLVEVNLVFHYFMANKIKY